MAEVQERFPLEPVERLLARPLEMTATPTGSVMSKTPLGELVEQAGYGRHVMSRWRKRGVPLYDADRLATHMGHHPTALWGDLWPRDWDEDDLKAIGW